MVYQMYFIHIFLRDGNNVKYFLYLNRFLKRFCIFLIDVINFFLLEFILFVYR